VKATRLEHFVNVETYEPARPRRQAKVAPALALGAAPGRRRRHSSFAPWIELLNSNVAVGTVSGDVGRDVMVVCGTTGSNLRMVATSFLASSTAKTSPPGATAAATGKPVK
jgi:hypothetical protein